jgi:hypothetical protein
MFGLDAHDSPAHAPTSGGSGGGGGRRRKLRAAMEEDEQLREEGRAACLDADLSTALLSGFMQQNTFDKTQTLLERLACACPAMMPAVGNDLFLTTVVVHAMLVSRAVEDASKAAARHNQVAGGGQGARDLYVAVSL